MSMQYLLVVLNGGFLDILFWGVHPNLGAMAWMAAHNEG